MLAAVFYIPYIQWPPHSSFLIYQQWNANGCQGGKNYVMIPLTAALDVIITWNAASDKVVTVMIFVIQINNLQQIQLDTEMKMLSLWQADSFTVSGCINSLRPRPIRRHFADDIFKCISENENEWISPRISLKFVPKVRINNIPSLVQIMAWRRPGDRPQSEPMMVSLLTHICVTRPQ